MKFTSVFALIALVLFSGCGTTRSKTSANTKEDVLGIINKVNTHWQQNNAPRNAFWDEAAYQTANMEAYFVTGNPEYKAYAERWAQKTIGKAQHPTTRPSGNIHTAKSQLMCFLAIGRCVSKPISICII